MGSVLSPVRCLILVTIVAVIRPGSAAAQVPDDLDPVPETEPTAPEPAAPEPPPPEPQPPVAPAQDAPELVRAYETAFNLFSEGRYAEVAAIFDEVATRSVDPARKASATEMAARARARMAEPPTSAKDGNDDGARTVFLVTSAVLGLAVYGPALPITLGVDGKNAAALYMLGAAGSVLVPYFATHRQRITWGMTDAYYRGASRGGYHGAAIATLLLPNNDGEDNTRAFTGIGAAASLLEGYGGLLYARRTGASSGLTHSIGNGIDYGMGFGLGTLLLVAGQDIDITEQKIAGAALIGSLGGMFAGHWYGTKRTPTWGDAEVHWVSGILGAYVATVPLLWAEPRNLRAVVAVVMAGGAGGLYLGDRLLEGRDFSAGQAVLTELFTYAGALTGAAVGMLLDEDPSGGTDFKVLATLSVAGAVGGFLLGFKMLDTRPKGPAAAGPPATTFHITPSITHESKGIAVVGTF